MILYIDACLRNESRTKIIADSLVKELGESFEYLNLYETDIPELNKKTLYERMEYCNKGDYSNNMFDLAKQFKEATKIVIAAPYWDFSFPAILKKYIEIISVSGLTFTYTDDGRPVGLCKADILYYVTTSGSKIYNIEHNYGYIDALVTQLFGIKKTKLFKAEELDIIGNDVDKIIRNCIDDMKKNL